MSVARAALIGTACSAVLVGLYLWQREPPQTGPAAPRAHARPAPAAPPVTPLAAAPRTIAASPLRAALVRAFRDAQVPREILDRLQAGDVAGVAREFAAANDAEGAVHLFDLAALCATEGHAPADGSPDERAALEATRDLPAPHATLAALIDARHAWQARFGAGCAGAALDPADVRRRLAAAAAAGNAMGVERLAAYDERPGLRLQSAALLGSARAQFRLGVAVFGTHPAEGRSWLEASAKVDADAEAYYAMCLLSGCVGAADPDAARAELESAARAGSLFALGVLASPDAAEGVRRWSRSDAIVTPVAPRDASVLGVSTPAAYGWATLAEQLANSGCFGFEFGIAADAFGNRAHFESTLRSAELEAARAAAEQLVGSTAATTRHALGCD